MMSESFSHQQTPIDSPFKLGATLTFALPAYSRFINGFFCKKCDRVTEHKKVKSTQICLECGFVLGKNQEQLAADVKAKKREWRRQRKIAKLERKLEALKMEASHD